MAAENANLAGNEKLKEFYQELDKLLLSKGARAFLECNPPAQISGVDPTYGTFSAATSVDGNVRVERYQDGLVGITMPHKDGSVDHVIVNQQEGTIKLEGVDAQKRHIEPMIEQNKAKANRLIAEAGAALKCGQFSNVEKDAFEHVQNYTKPPKQKDGKGGQVP
jgi:hypothetical protein